MIFSARLLVVSHGHLLWQTVLERLNRCRMKNDFTDVFIYQDSIAAFKLSESKVNIRA